MTSGSDKTVKLWNPHRKLFLKSYCGHGNEVLDACASSDSSQILSGGVDKTVILWDVSSGKPLRRLRVHSGNVTCVKFNEESNLAFSGSLDNTVMIWDIRAFNFQPIQVLKEAKDSISAIIVTDHEIVTGSLDSKIRCYDIRSGVLSVDYIGEPIVSLNLTRDGQCFIASTANGIIWLFDKTSGELLNEYSGHTTGDFCIESSVDRKDRNILSGSTDGCVYCWDLIGSKVSHKLVHSSGEVVHSLHPHPTGDYLMTATKNEIHLWGIEEMDLQDEPEVEA